MSERETEIWTDPDSEEACAARHAAKWAEEAKALRAAQMVYNKMIDDVRAGLKKELGKAHPDTSIQINLGLKFSQLMTTRDQITEDLAFLEGA